MSDQQQRRKAMMNSDLWAPGDEDPSRKYPDQPDDFNEPDEPPVTVNSDLTKCINNILKDSGKREEFPTGSRRDVRSGKGRYDLLSPATLRRDASLLERGAAKYGDRNWEKGQPESRLFDSAFRHLMYHLAGDRTEDHLAAVRWNVGAIMHFEEKGRQELLDLPWRNPGGVK